MEDRTYIEALMSAPARPEQDYTAQEAAAKRMGEINATFQQIATIVTEAWENLKRSLTPIVRFFQRLVQRLIHHFKPLLPRKYKVKARQRPISTRRVLLRQRAKSYREAILRENPVAYYPLDGEY